MLVIHHSGRQRNRKPAHERGSSALAAAADAVMALTDRNGAVTLGCDKQKDGAEFEPMRFKLKPVTLDDGVTSCVVVGADSVGTGPVLEEKHRAALQSLKSFGEAGAETVQWQKETPNIKKRTFYRTLEELKGSGYVELSGDRNRLTELGGATAK